jgi:hypothetical protein
MGQAISLATRLMKFIAALNNTPLSFTSFCYAFVASKTAQDHPLLCLGWQCCQHVGNMSARQPNVGTFGRHGPVVPTQN